MAALHFFILLLLVFVLIDSRAPIFFWTILLGITLVVLTYLAKLNILFLILAWFFYLFAALFANITSFRQRYFTYPLIQNLQKQIPPISDTEQEAIQAGSVWWEKDLFCGRPRWKNLLAMPTPTLTPEEQRFIDNEVETVCRMVDDWEIMHNTHDLSQEVWNYLKKERFFGLVIPKEYGGHGFSALAHSTIILKLATRSISVAVNTMVPNSLGPGELLAHYGTDAQKNYFLPRLASAEEIPCFALTAPDAGSDASSLNDHGIVCKGEYQGEEILGIRLNWDKRYITLAPVATLLGIAFKLYDPELLLGKKVNIGITLCLIPTSHPGVEIGNRHLPLNLAFMNGPTRGKDVFIPLDWVIGGVSEVGRGWHMLMECLSIGRAISLPALSTACGKLAFRVTGAYAKLRRQFNVPIAQFEGVEEALAYIGGTTYLLEASRLMTASAVDQKLRPAIASAIAKYHMTEMSRQIISHAMDIHAGHGIQMGPRNILANAYMAMPISITVEGANILTRNLIIFGQGAIRCHPYILKEINLLAEYNAINNFSKIDRTLLSHIGYTLSNLIRSLWTGLTGGYLLLSPVRGPTAHLYRQLTRMSAALALLSDMTMLVFGSSLKRKERVSARLGDILSYLYLASAVLRYFHNQHQPKSDVDYVNWCGNYCLYQIQIACDDLLNNFPKPLLGKILHWIIFPWRYNAYRKPSDTLSHKIVLPMLSPSDFRDRLTQHLYKSNEVQDAVCRMEMAFIKIQALEPTLKKFQNAIRNGTVAPEGSHAKRLETAVKLNILNEKEMQDLLEFDKLYQEIIRVNEFSFDLHAIIH